eukprot:NODE_15_length_50561_cov_0.608081.p35 type:complete len:108 gc:universal NODE_15_length_50561_cov_0.608081:8574-8251(-)
MLDRQDLKSSSLANLRHLHNILLAIKIPQIYSNNHLSNIIINRILVTRQICLYLNRISHNTTIIKQIQMHHQICNNSNIHKITPLSPVPIQINIIRILDNLLLMVIL